MKKPPGTGRDAWCPAVRDHSDYRAKSRRRRSFGFTLSFDEVARVIRGQIRRRWKSSA